MADGYDDVRQGAAKRDTSKKQSAGKRRKKKKATPFSRAMKKLGRSITGALSKLEAWTAASRRNRIITIASACAAGLLIVGGVILAVVSATNSKPRMEMTLVEEEVAQNYTFVDVSEYAGTLLEKTADAGMDYINDTLFVGDSNMARLVMYGLLDYAHVIGVESMGIQGVTGTPAVYFSGYSEPVTVVKAISLMKPRRIIFNYGTNNLLGSSTDDFIESYDGALNKIKTAYPYCDIIIMAIHPLGENRSNTSLKQSQVDDYNLALIKYAKEAGYPYLDTAEVLKGENGWLKEKFAYSDGVHLTKEGLNAVLSYARTHARIVDDARPKPIGSVPTQVAPPVKETEKDFDPALAASSAQSLFAANGFTVATGHSGTAQVTWSWGWPIEGVKGGTEGNVAQSLYSAYLAQNSVTSGAVIVSYSQNTTEYLFTVSVYAATTHNHTYGNWKATSATEHTGACTDANCPDADGKKTITHTPAWGAWSTDGTTCTRSCTGYQGCTVKETHTTVLSSAITPYEGKAPTATVPGSGYRTCTVSGCGAKHTVVIPATGSAHTHAPAATWSSDATNHWHACTGSGCTEILDKAAHTMVQGTPVAPTCAADGHTPYTCSVCGYAENRDIKTATGHAWGEWAVTTPAGAGVAGVETRTCTECSTTETREIPALESETNPTP